MIKKNLPHYSIYHMARKHVIAFWGLLGTHYNIVGFHKLYKKK